MALAKEQGVGSSPTPAASTPQAWPPSCARSPTGWGSTLTIAHVEGDNLIAARRGTRLRYALTANAYLGAFGIAAALEAGADVVVTGRVTDASRGRRSGDRRSSAGAGRTRPAGRRRRGRARHRVRHPGDRRQLLRLHRDAPCRPRSGFPIAEISADGSVVITKHEGTGGAVTVDTVTAQLVYEMRSTASTSAPTSPPSSTRSGSTQDGPDRVAITGVTGEPATGDDEGLPQRRSAASATGRVPADRARHPGEGGLIRTQIERALAAAPAEPRRVVARPHRSPDAATEEGAACLLRVTSRTRRRRRSAGVQRRRDRAGAGVLPGFHAHAPARPRDAVRHLPGGVRRRGEVAARRAPAADGTRRTIAAPHHGRPPILDATRTRAEAVDPTADRGRGATIGCRSARSRTRAPATRAATPTSASGSAASRDARRRIDWLLDLLTDERRPRAAARGRRPRPRDPPAAQPAAVNIVIHGLLGEGVAVRPGSTRRPRPSASGCASRDRATSPTSPAAAMRGPAVESTDRETPEDASPCASTRTFTERESCPHLHEWEDAGEVPASRCTEAAARPACSAIGFPEEVGGQGGDLIDADRDHRGDIEAGGSTGLIAALFTHGIALPHIIAHGERRPDRPLRAADAGRRADRLARHHRAGRRVRRRRASRTRAVRDGDEYVVNGAKTFITSGVRADFVTTAVRTGGAGHGGISLLVIDKGTPGFTVARPLRKMGWHCSDTAELSFDDVRVPAANMVGEENRVRARSPSSSSPSGSALAVQGYATAQRCLDLDRGVLPGAGDVRQAAGQPPGHPAQARRDAPAGRRSPGRDARRPSAGRRRRETVDRRGRAMAKKTGGRGL